MGTADIMFTAVVLLFLLYGAVWDAKKRIIPDTVPVMLSVLGITAIFSRDIVLWQVPLFERIAGFAIPTAAMLVLYFIKKPVGGGDLKLSAALGFLLGLTQFAIAYAIGGVIALVWAAVKKQKSVPLGVFLSIGVAACLML